jgi:tousled-like kinase
MENYEALRQNLKIPPDRFAKLEDRLTSKDYHPPVKKNTPNIDYYANVHRSKGTRKENLNSFTEDDDYQLMILVSKYNGNWERIGSTAYFRHRSIESIKDRYHFLMKKTLNELGNGKRRNEQYMGRTKKRIKRENDYFEKTDPNPKLLMKVEKLENKIKDHQQLISLQTNNITELQSSLEEYKRYYQNSMRITAKLIRKSETLKREKVKKSLVKKGVRLGRYISERNGPELNGIWKDGEAQNEIDAKRGKFNQKVYSLNNVLKNLSQQEQLFKKDANVLPTQHRVLMEKEELLRLKLHKIEQKKLELLEEESLLDIEKNLYIKEGKRVRDESCSPFKNMPILKSRYLLTKLLGKGGFSEVYKAFDLMEVKKVACKIHQVNPTWSETKKQNYIKHSCREYNIQKSLNHPRIVNLFDVFEIDENSFCSVLEYCKGGDLDSLLKKKNRLPVKEARLIISQIVTGVLYLNEQERPIIHYDLKPGNILFDSDGGVKITDFGLSKLIETDEDSIELTSQGAGTYWYLPPECFLTGSTPKISSKVDVWSCGVILFQMIYGKKPFGDNHTQQSMLSQGLISTVMLLKFPEDPPLEDEAKNFIQRCLTPLQAERPSIFDIVEDEFLIWKQ